MMKLGDVVVLYPGVTAEVVGRTYEESPRVDLKTTWGRMNGVPMSTLPRVTLNELRNTQSEAA